jgi:hypothetical protein
MDWKMRVVLFLTSMAFAAVANIAATVILHRMEELGFDTRPSWNAKKQFLPYYGYWKAAPVRGWSRTPLVTMVISFILATAFLISSGLRLPK